MSRDVQLIMGDNHHVMVLYSREFTQINLMITRYMTISILIAYFAIF